ncbi:pyridoxal phosphate-dependent aminotransferase [Legionella nagasakiensis]|uniref:pyridoxal phosphate-dependent aminotransferase n=1 Tax=Legionella nagasakiensis TaxID=535290 RepID=UPI0010561420|nr:pyridoxal phosphate-dependent aminotransferase [Legionella nagasakiensis]
MLTPNGLSADKIEKVMLLAMWANTLNEEIALQDSLKEKKMIFAGLGKPTYPLNSHTIASYKSYWQKMDELATKWFLNPEEMQENSAIDYGDPQGDKSSRVLMAEAMSSWYESDIKSEHVLFTVGGIGALRVIFETFNALYAEPAGYRIITPFPHYSAYSNNPLHRLHAVDVMQQSGYKLTARAIETSIKEAYRLAEIDQGWPRAILICNPSNPLGNVIDEGELKKIVAVLRRYPSLHIIFDEAYAEMCYVEMPSFLKIAPDLKERTIILRSATKALSAAGERMAIILVFEKTLLNELLHKNISYFIHAPRSAQMAYAQTMANFDRNERKKLSAFYEKKVGYVMKRLQAMGAAMPCPFYHVEATFYALGDFSDLFGLELPKEAERALQKRGIVQTGEDIAYYLLFKEAVMVAPLSYFGLSKNSGFVRITCSGNSYEQKELMDRLEQRLFKARKIRKLALLHEIERKMPSLKTVDTFAHERILHEISFLTDEKETCLALKSKNRTLMKLHSLISETLSSKASAILDGQFVKTMQVSEVLSCHSSFVKANACTYENE